MKQGLEMIELFEELESIIEGASNIPFSNKSGIDKSEVLKIIDDIKTAIPEEVTQAIWINKERQKIISDAKLDAEQIIEQAEKEAERIKADYQKSIEELKENSEEVVKAYVESSEPVIKAEQKSQEMIQKAERVATEIRLGSIEYADDVLSNLEHNLKVILSEITRDREELKSE